MAKKPVPEIDDELFDEVYGKEYTGPPGLTANNERSNSIKRPNANANANADSDEEDEPHDPNAVPTDFTSREAKAWVARAKATERNWKKRKEEEMICKICGESGHFTQVWLCFCCNWIPSIMGEWVFCIYFFKFSSGRY